eukprot:6129715-Alexandrium_andersonii.AAC.1
MSASLVGSEMCIRDSTLAHATQTTYNTTTTTTTTMTSTTTPTNTDDKSCLLYTSDAADDM